jgi:hypothetical protein
MTLSSYSQAITSNKGAEAESESVINHFIRESVSFTIFYCMGSLLLIAEASNKLLANAFPSEIYDGHLKAVIQFVWKPSGSTENVGRSVPR